MNPSSNILQYVKKTSMIHTMILLGCTINISPGVKVTREIIFASIIENLYTYVKNPRYFDTLLIAHKSEYNDT